MVFGVVNQLMWLFKMIEILETVDSRGFAATPFRILPHFWKKRTADQAPPTVFWGQHLPMDLSENYTLPRTLGNACEIYILNPKNQGLEDDLPFQLGDF